MERGLQEDLVADEPDVPGVDAMGRRLRLRPGPAGPMDGERLGIALEVVGHGEHGLILVPRQDNLRCLVS